MIRDDQQVRVANVTDAEAIGRLLYAFNREYDDPTPEPDQLARRVKLLIEGGDTEVVLIGPGPDGLAVLRLRQAIWSESLECYLAELYVVPNKRGSGLGKALLQGAIDLVRSKGATYMDLGTSEDGKAAIGLYESFGFNNHESKPNGPINYYYEREL